MSSIKRARSRSSGRRLVICDNQDRLILRLGSREILAKATDRDRIDFIWNHGGQQQFVLGSPYPQSAVLDRINYWVNSTQSEGAMICRNDPDNQLSGVSSCRQLAGPTRGLYKFLCCDEHQFPWGNESKYVYPGLIEHPAFPAVRYLVAMGANVSSCVRILRYLSDIRPLLHVQPSSSVPFSYLLLAEHPDDLIQTLVTGQSQWISVAIESLRNGDQIPDKWRHLIEGTVGNIFAEANAGSRTLLSSLINRHEDFVDGVTYATSIAMQIIVNQWLATEYHQDFFDDRLFDDGLLTARRRREYQLHAAA